MTVNQERLQNFIQEINTALDAASILAEDEGSPEPLAMETVDRLAFMAARADQRRLPRKIIIPFDLALESEPKCIAGTGKLLWIGTDNGLYRYDTKNKNWKRCDSGY